MGKNGSRSGSRPGCDGQSRQGGGLLGAAIAQGAQHFQHLAPGRERTPIGTLVQIHRLHELDLLLRVLLLAGSRIDLAAAFALFLTTVLAAAAFDRDGNGPLAAVAVMPAVVIVLV